MEASRIDNDLRVASSDDVLTLAQMNHMLITDEGSDNPMSIEQLEERMRRWLASGEYTAVFILRHGEIVGYLLFREEEDAYNAGHINIYVRQFFIKRAYRRRGIGKTAFEQVARAFFPDEATVLLEVLSTNMQGRAFWERLGFQPFFTTYRR